jgi:hypothetical protein
MSDTLAAEIAKPRSVALYMSLDFKNCFELMEVKFVDHDEHYDPLPEGSQPREYVYQTYVRVTDPVPLQPLQAIKREDVVANAVSALTEQEREAYRRLNERLKEIRDRKQQLLALTHQPSEASAVKAGG